MCFWCGDLYEKAFYLLCSKDAKTAVKCFELELENSHLKFEIKILHERYRDKSELEYIKENQRLKEELLDLEIYLANKDK